MKAFVGHSFSPSDEETVRLFESLLDAFEIMVVGGERPSAGSISEKIKERIRGADIFVGIFTRVGKMEGKEEYYTSPWVIDEKAFAVAEGKKVILLVEEGVKEIGGIQGDAEYIQFQRTNLAPALIKFASILWEIRRKALSMELEAKDSITSLTSQEKGQNLFLREVISDLVKIFGYKFITGHWEELYPIIFHFMVTKQSRPTKHYRFISTFINHLV
ncbi:MAG: hypothetical protein QXX41_06185 [Nitrososphaerota archaeon]